MAWRMGAQVDIQLTGQCHQVGHLRQIAAEFSGQVHHSRSIAEGHAQQKPDTVSIGGKFEDLVRIVHHEAGATKAQGRADIGVSLDGMGVDGPSRGAAHPLDQFDLARRRPGRTPHRPAEGLEALGDEVAL
jgi:hypothetical protein